MTDDRPTPKTDALIERQDSEYANQATPMMDYIQRKQLIAHARAMEAQLDQALDVLTAIMPYVEEDYHDGCATERFRRAVTEARAVLDGKANTRICGSAGS